MRYNVKEDILELTKEWTGERFDDGRPRVPDSLLERLRDLTFEEAWFPLVCRGYNYQYENEFKMTHPTRKLVGRAVTAVMIPSRPDVHDYLLKYGHEQEGRKGYYNQWVIDTLVENDVVVIDIFDKIVRGTCIGGNLSTAIATRTKNGGAVIWGGVRDLEQIVEIDNIQVFHRGADPSGIGDVIMTGFNVPCRIGRAICLPGDVVFGTLAGVVFIPPHMAETAVAGAEKNHVKDIFGFIRLDEKVYTTAQIDASWTKTLMDDFMDWFNKDPKAARYRHLTWDDEIAQAAKTEDNNAQVRL